jgi:hypothetical protein
MIKKYKSKERKLGGSFKTAFIFPPFKCKYTTNGFESQVKVVLR